MGDKKWRTQRYIEKLQEAIPSAKNGLIMVSVEAAKELIGLLEEMGPQKVISATGPTHDRIGYCPNCRLLIRKLGSKNFCGLCGQAVKWDA